jgi:hypothetical protein
VVLKKGVWRHSFMPDSNQHDIISRLLLPSRGNSVLQLSSCGGSVVKNIAPMEGSFVCKYFLNLTLTLCWNHEIKLIRFLVPCLCISKFIVDKYFLYQSFKYGLLNIRCNTSSWKKTPGNTKHKRNFDKNGEGGAMWKLLLAVTIYGGVTSERWGRLVRTSH